MLWNCDAGEDMMSLGYKEIKPVSPKGNQPWIFIGRNDAEAEAPILGPPDAKSWLIGKDPDTGKTEDRRRRGWQRMRWLNSITGSIDMSLSKPQEMLKDRGACRATVHGGAKSQTWLSDWTTTLFYIHGWLDIDIKIDIGVYVCVCAYRCLFPSFILCKGLEIMTVPMSILVSGSWFLSTISQWKKLGLLGELADFRAGAVKI